MNISEIWGVGILAADEATPAMGQRLASVGVENTEENVLKARVDYDRVDYDSRNCEHRTEMGET